MKRNCRLSWPVVGVVCALVLLVAGPAAVVRGQVVEGTLYVNDRDAKPITALDLALFLDRFIPNNTQRLLIMTQCYSGAFTTTPALNTAANTAIGAATSPEEMAHYGGYNDDAATALRPGAGRTGQSVHDAGVAGRSADPDDFPETPTTGGGLALGQFSLENVTANGNVRSRHILVYSGRPDEGFASRGKLDSKDRDVIKDNFKNEMNTTVTTVGGPGGDGWDHPGSLNGLLGGFGAVKAAIDASPDPSKEQFILFVGDHGGLRNVTRQTTLLPANGRGSVATNFQTFRGDGPPRELLLADGGNVPGFDFFVPFDGFNVPIEFGPNGEHFPLHRPGDFVMEIMRRGFAEPPRVLSEFLEQYSDLNGNRILGDVPGEGLNFFFPVPEGQFLNDFFDVALDISVVNNNLFPVVVGEVDQTTGNTARVPEPGGFAVAVGLVGLLSRGSRRAEPDLSAGGE